MARLNTILDEELHYAGKRPRSRACTKLMVAIEPSPDLVVEPHPIGRTPG